MVLPPQTYGRPTSPFALAAASMFQVTRTLLGVLAGLACVVFCWPLRVAACAVPAKVGPVTAVTGTLIATAATAALASQLGRILRRLRAAWRPGHGEKTTG